MIVFNVDLCLTDCFGKGETISLLVATMFHKFEQKLRDEKSQYDFDKKKELLNIFQNVYSAANYIKTHDLSTRTEYSGGVVIEDLCLGANAVNLPENIVTLLRKYSEFFKCNSEYRFVFERNPIDIVSNKINLMVDYLKRSILKNCNISKYEMFDDCIIVELSA